MNRIPSEHTADAYKAVQALTVAELVSLVLQRRWLLVTGFLLGLVLAAIYVAFASPLYRTQSVFNLQYILFAEYKRYSPALTDRDRFIDYATRSEKFSGSELEKIRRLISGSDAVGKWIHPIFAITKTDIKDVAELPKDPNVFAGVEIDISLNSGELAQKLAVVCGNYVRDFILDGKIQDLVMPGVSSSSTELTRKELDIIRQTFDLEQLKRRRDELKSVANRYPGSSRETQRQVISTQEGGERYLSPVTQVIGVEAQIVEANADLGSLRRDTERLRALIEFYKQARTGIATAKTGEQLGLLKGLFNSMQAKTGASEAVRDAIGSIRVELDQLQALSTDYMRFAGVPSSQSQLRSVLVWSPLVLGPVIGLMLAMLLAIAVEWWRRNQAAIRRARN